jgi:hypothetical protein
MKQNDIQQSNIHQNDIQKKDIRQTINVVTVEHYSNRLPIVILLTNIVISVILLCVCWISFSYVLFL